MTREMFVKVVTKALRRTQGHSPEAQAEAVAILMDDMAELMGESPGPSQNPPKAYEPAPAPPSFPSPNPQAIVSHPEPAMPPEPQSRLIIPASYIPDKIEPANSSEPGQPLRSLRAPAQKMKVEDLSRLIQERTPDPLWFDVPMEDGSTRRCSFKRNVISQHAFDSVQLCYFPPNTLPTAREATEVQASISIDDLPIDLSAVVEKLKQEAIASLRPRRTPVSVAPPPTAGPVRHSGDTYQDPVMQQQTQAIFNGMG